MGDPKVSIVISTFNRLSKLKLAISSILEQSYRNYELVIVNDGSKDGTREFLDKTNIDAKIKVIHNPVNLGLPKSLNLGVNAASGTLIARIDDDDLWIDNNKLKKQVSFLESNEEYGLVGTNYRVGDRVHNYPENDDDIRNQILFRCPFRHSTVVFRKDVWQKAGGYDEQLPYSEDWDLWLKIGRVAKFKNLRDVTTEVSEGDNLTSKYFVKQLPINNKMIKKYTDNYPGGVKVVLYHNFLKAFFSIVPPGSPIHRFFQKIFLMVFQNK